MKTPTQTILIRMEFLGFRYHGWQEQPGQQTLEGMLRKTLKFILPGHRSKILGAGRTDAKVSATDFALQCIISPYPDLDTQALRKLLNENLPPDMRVVAIEAVPEGFNVISDVTAKQYSYFFCFGEKPHPFAAPFFGYFRGDLDMSAMKAAARQFEGTHDFSAFIAGNTEGKKRERTVEQSGIVENQAFTASFFPDDSYEYRVTGKGFGRYQVRLMMAALVAIGQGTAPPDALEHSLKHGTDWPIGAIAPGSGLQLQMTRYGNPGNSSYI